MRTVMLPLLQNHCKRRVKRNLIPNPILPRNMSYVACIPDLTRKSQTKLPYNIKSHNFSTNKLPTGFIDEVSNIKDVSINTNKYELDRHGHGESYHETAPPSCILQPSTIESISSIMNTCSKYKVPIIAFGQGTSVEGHVNAIHGGVSLDMSFISDIEMNEDSIMEDFMVTVGAGTTRNTLNEALRHTGLQFMVDPGADASIGGMVATGASGTSAVKYGTMKDNIVGLQAVLPNGEIITCGSKALKSSAGYDITRLLCGSEGTLAIITKVTVKLHPIPEHTAAIVLSFPTLFQAASAVTTIRQLGIPIDRCELLDALSIDAFNQYNKSLQMPLLPHLFLELSASSELSLNSHVEILQDILSDKYDPSKMQIKYKEEERRLLWSARHQLYYATLALRPGATKAIVSDVCVPLSSFANIIQQSVDLIQEYDLIGPCFGHAGDGNFHCIFPVKLDPNNDNDDDDDDDNDDENEYMERVHKVYDIMIRKAIDVGGTCTGEHGIGYGKMKYLEMQYGSHGVHVMRSIKKAMDPLNIMNPGKIVSF